MQLNYLKQSKLRNEDKQQSESFELLRHVKPNSNFTMSIHIQTIKRFNHLRQQTTRIENNQNQALI